MRINKKGTILISVVAILLFLSAIVLSFVFWLSVQSKGTVKKQIISRIQYYGETGAQKAIRMLQESPTWYSKMTDEVTTDYYTFNMQADSTTPESKVEITIEDVP